MNVELFVICVLLGGVTGCTDGLWLAGVTDKPIQERQNERATPTDEQKETTTPTDEQKENTTPIHKQKENTTPTDEQKGNTTPTDEQKENTTPIHKQKENTTPSDEQKGNTTPTAEQMEIGTPIHKQKENTTPKDEQKKKTTPIHESGIREKGNADATQSESGVSERPEFVMSSPAYNGLFCPAEKLWKLHWPRTRTGQTASLECLGTDFPGSVTRYCRLVKPFWFLKKEFAIWGPPSFCKKRLPDDEGKPAEPPSCPQDTSYATEWPETPVNTTARAECPRNLSVSDNLNATRRCELVTLGGIQSAQWQKADLLSCLKPVINESMVAPANDTMEQKLDDWLADHSCPHDTTTSAMGIFEWNTTIVGGFSISTCPYGFIVPIKDTHTFIQISIGLTSSLKELHDALKAANLTEKLEEIGRNISSLVEGVGQFIANKTSEIVQDIISSNFTQSELFIGFADWLESLKDKFAEVSTLPDESDEETGYLVSERGRMRRSNTKPLNDADLNKWTTSTVTRLNLLEALMGYPFTSRWRQSKTSYPKQEDHFGPVANDLRSLTSPYESNEFLPTNWRSRYLHEVKGKTGPELTFTASASETGHLDGILNSISYMTFPNISKIIEVFHDLSRTPARKCREGVDGQSVVWGEAKTWMCRSENASLSQDLDRALMETKNIGLGSEADLTFIKIIVSMWSFMERWGDVIPQAILMLIQMINHLLSLPPFLPQVVNNKIISTIENLPNTKLPNLPDNMSVVTIVTDNMVLALEKVEQDTLDGVLFASIKPNDQREIETHAEIFSLSDGPNIGKNVFEQKSGALNDSLRGLDLDSMEEYFYVPPGVFFSHHTGHCPISDETNGTVAWKNTSVLQFVIYENDRLFRTNRNEVAVDTANDVPENEQAEWKVTSRVISATISGRFVWGLETPVIISLKHHKKVGGGGRVLCVFWDFQGGDGSGAWSTKGCRVSFTSAEHTICECNHLTNYAVIIDIGAQLGNGSLPRVHCQVLEVISYTGCALSLIGLITTMGMLVSVRKLREAKTTPTRLMLCLSLIISMTFYLTGINQTSSRHACTAFACCIHYFTLVALMWMGVEGAYLYRNIVLVAITPPRHMFKICCTVAWGVPAVIVGGVAIFDLEAYGSFERCWISDPTVFFAAFLVPAMLIVICNFVVFLMVMWVLFKRPFSARRYTTGKEHREYSRRRREIFGIISITALLGLTWILGSFSVGDDGVRLTSLYLFTLFNSTQGFFIFLFYGLLSCLTTRAVPSPVGVPPPLTTATSKLGQLVASTVALNNKILKIRPKRKGSAGESIFTSFSDLPLEFGNNIPAFQCDLSPIGTKKETLAGGQRPQVLDLTSCNFVLSAGILNAGNQRPMIYLVNSGPGSDMWAGSDYRKREDFVLGTGIIFSGKS